MLLLLLVMFICVILVSRTSPEALEKMQTELKFIEETQENFLKVISRCFSFILCFLNFGLLLSWSKNC